jgi:uncharacterized protein (TIGR03792 family)
MVIEQLSFRVPLAEQTRFIAADAAIWTATLSDQPGFLGKEVWREADDPDHLHLVIRWIDRSLWHAVPPRLLAETEAAFVDALGVTYPLLRCVDQDVLG